MDFFIKVDDFINNNSHLQHNEIVHDDQTVKQKPKRITIDTYVSPPPCLDCPGENGTAIVILVRYILLKNQNLKIY